MPRTARSPRPSLSASKRRLVNTAVRIAKIKVGEARMRIGGRNLSAVVAVLATVSLGLSVYLASVREFRSAVTLAGIAVAVLCLDCMGRRRPASVSGRTGDRHVRVTMIVVLGIVCVTGFVLGVTRVLR